MSASITLVGTLLGVAALVSATWIRPALRVVYNASESAPRGWYRVVRPDQLRVGDYVVARLPEAVARLAASRGYLPRSVPALKRIVAVEGQTVCVHNGVVSVDGAPIASTIEVDGKGRTLTAWRHCRRRINGEIFLLNAAAPASFDSRYFGPIDASFVCGRALPMAQIERQ
jgi:conjugative transfer signal peptidase TraF